MAAVATHDKNVNIIGSSDATTCIIVVVRHSGLFFYILLPSDEFCITFLYLKTGSGAVALAHLDGNGIDEAVSTMVARVQNLALGYPEGRIELQLIGGYKDQQGYAEDLFYNIMRKYFFYIFLL